MKGSRGTSAVWAVWLSGGALLLVQVVLWALVFRPEGGSSGDGGAMLRSVASKLSSVGVKGEAAKYYAAYLDRSDVSPTTRAQVCLAIGGLLKDEGRLEEALGYLYQVEELAPKSQAARDAAPLIVEVLDRLGHTQAAQVALSTRSSLDRNRDETRADGAIVARIGDREITRADLDQAISALPAPVRKQLSDPDRMKEFLQQYVAQELLYDKALKRGLDRDPAVRQQLDQVRRQVVVNRLLEEQLQDRVKPDEQDLRNYYQAHLDQFKGAQGETPGFDEVKNQVLQAYVGSKAQGLAQELLQEALAAQEVQIFPDVLAGGTADTGEGR